MIRALALLLPLAGPAQALELALPAGAELTRQQEEPQGTLSILTGPMKDGFAPRKIAEGRITQTAYRFVDVPAPGELMAPLREQLRGAGFTDIFTCETESCGGFDFRFALDVLPPPDMFIDLGDFLYLSAGKPGAPDHISVVASRSRLDGYLHVTVVDSDGAIALKTAPPAAESPARASQTQPQSDLATDLEVEGRVVLEDLIFPSGTFTLPDSDYPSLTALAAYLKANPEARVALVGHTDASGPLAMNIDISRQRAAAARAKLIDRYDVSEDQVDAEGMGYLAPRATNLTEAGRETNRRVEVILTSTRP